MGNDYIRAIVIQVTNILQFCQQFLFYQKKFFLPGLSTFPPYLGQYVFKLIVIQLGMSCQDSLFYSVSLCWSPLQTKKKDYI